MRPENLAIGPGNISVGRHVSGNGAAGGRCPFTTCQHETLLSNVQESTNEISNFITSCSNFYVNMLFLYGFDLKDYF